MEIILKDYKIKRISFEEFEKSFFEALKPGALDNIIFYKFLAEGVEISFSYDNFIIYTIESYKNIKEKFPGSENDTEVVLSDENPFLHPSVKKFIIYYTHNRGIKEM